MTQPGTQLKATDVVCLMMMLLRPLSEAFCRLLLYAISSSYTMGCPPVRGDNPRALASGLSYVQVDKHGITILYHLRQCRSCTSSDISC